MKRRLRKSMVLLVSLVLVFMGCGKAEEPIVQEEADIVVEEMIETEEETPKEEVPLGVHIDTRYKTYYFEESDEAYLYLQYCDVVLEGTGYENLKRNVENWFLERSGELRNLYAEVEKTAKDDAKREDFYGYTLYQTVSTARVDESVISLVDETYQYTGGANGMTYRGGVNFDSKSGKKLVLKDILIDAEGFAKASTERMVSELNRLHGEELFDDYAQTLESLWKSENGLEWYLDATGIVIVVQQYDVGPEIVGTTEIHMPYKDFGPYIKDAYLPVLSEGVARIEKNEELFLELPNREEALPLMLQFEWVEYATNCALWLGKDKTTLSDFATMEDAYLIRNGEEVYCLVELDMASDDYITYVYRLTNGVIDEVAEVNGAIDEGNVNIKQVMMESWVNMLGTYGGVKTYCFDENKGFTTEDEESLFLKNEHVLTTTVDLPVMIDELESILPAGSHIILNATDNESYVKFTIQETGQTGTLRVERNREEYQVMIDDMSEYDCFEMLPYAG